jgi:hypothetical protein
VRNVQTKYFSGVFGTSKSTKEFAFKYTDEDLINRPRQKENIIETYERVISAAFYLEISYNNIYDSLCGITEKTKEGYQFQYH